MRILIHGINFAPELTATGKYTGEMAAWFEPASRGTTARLKTLQLSGGRKEHFAIRFEGLLKIDRAGYHRLILASDDGSRLFVHGRLIVDNGGPHPHQEIGGKVRLAKGLHPIRIDYFEATGDSSLQLSIEDEAGERAELGEGDFFHMPQ